MDYFGEDKYWQRHLNDALEDDYWLEEYLEFLPPGGKCLDLGCGLGQYSRFLMERGFDVTSADISELALREVRKFNKSTQKIDMREPLPFGRRSFDVVLTNLSIHYFDDRATRELADEITRILRPNGVLIGSVNSAKHLRDHPEMRKIYGEELEPNFYQYPDGRTIRLFDLNDFEKYFGKFRAEVLKEDDTVRYSKSKQRVIFVLRKTS